MSLIKRQERLVAISGMGRPRAITGSRGRLFTSASGTILIATRCACTGSRRIPQQRSHSLHAVTRYHHW